MTNYDFDNPRALTASETLYAALSLASTATSFLFNSLLIWLLSRQYAASHGHVGHMLRMGMAIFDAAFVLNAGVLMVYILSTHSIGGLGQAGCTAHGALVHSLAISSRVMHLLAIVHQYATMVLHVNYSYARWQQISALAIVAHVAAVCVIELALPDTAIVVMPSGTYCNVDYAGPSATQKAVSMLVLVVFSSVHNVALLLYVRVHRHMYNIKVEVTALAATATAMASAQQKIAVAKTVERMTLQHSIVEFFTRLLAWIPVAIEMFMGVAGVPIPPAFDCFVGVMCMTGPTVTAIMTIRDDPTVRSEFLLTIGKVKRRLGSHQSSSGQSSEIERRKTPHVSDQPPPGHRSTVLADSYVDGGLTIPGPLGKVDWIPSPSNIEGPSTFAQ
ncbi:hypothetical protein RI367_007920 [Sorochytrium milnesiophthora]